MIKLYKKNELTFSLVWIIVYVVLTSLADAFSEKLGVLKSLTFPLHLAFVILLILAINKLKIAEKCGLCWKNGSMKTYLFFIPLLLIVSVNFWNGLTLNFTLLESMFYAVSALCVGFIEEIVFRGFLFHAIAKNGHIKSAILISSLTFGIGHIVNLLNGADLFGTCLQICYAAALGFLFTVILYKGKTLIPCIVTHSLLNSVSTFAIEGSRTFYLVASAVLCIVSILYALWIWKKAPESGRITV